MIVYVSEQGAKIHREDERLIIRFQGQSRMLFSHKLRQLILLGNIHLTAQARSLLLEKNIDTVFLSSHGSYRGRLITKEAENVFLRKKQYELLDNSQFQLKIAREIVMAKLHNQAVMLGRIKRSQHQNDMTAGIEELKALIHKAREEKDIESLRGMEGAGANIYFHNFTRAFHKDWGFHGRTRRPPSDPVNVILSLTYTLLVDRCHTACRLAGLDPCPANLHTLEYGRQSLPLDLVEEFRTIIGDALAIALFNMRMLTEEDFVSPETCDDKDKFPKMEKARGLVLKKEALKKVLAAFSKKMETEFHHPHEAREMTYSEAVNLQAKEYRKVVEGKTEKYKPVVWH